MKEKGCFWAWERGETYFLDVDAVACTAEDEACAHCFCESTGLVKVSALSVHGFSSAPYLV